MNTKEIIIPEGWTIDSAEGNKIIIKEESKTARLPKTWEEWVKENIMVNEGEYYIDNDSELVLRGAYDYRNVDNDQSLLPSKDLAEAILALIKLIRLRDTYRQGWKPDWTDENSKNVISYTENDFETGMYTGTGEILSFQSSNIRDEFYNNFKDLIEKIKPLYD